MSIGFIICPHCVLRFAVALPPRGTSSASLRPGQQITCPHCGKPFASDAADFYVSADMR